MHWNNQWSTNLFTVGMTSFLVIGSHWLRAWQSVASGQTPTASGD